MVVSQNNFYNKIILGDNHMGASKLNNQLNIIGKNIKSYRLKNKLSQNDVCCKMALLGISLYQYDIYRIENGKRTIKDFEIYGFSKIFKITPNELFVGIEKNFEL